MRGSRVAAGFERLIGDVWRERGLGDFWGYMLVADGAAELMIERDLGAWDLAAPWIVVEEAGGRITDFDGRRDVFGSRGDGLQRPAACGFLDAAARRVRTAAPDET